MTATNEPLPRLTVIVPAYNESARILDCIATLKAQSYPSNLLQIIIVDNGSKDDTFDILRRTPGILALQETQPGSYAARNLALRHATGDIVGFTDADCSADPNWVRNAVAHLKNPDIGIVAGHVALDFGHGGRPSSSELFEQCFAFKQAENAALGVCVTANWFSPRMLIENMGGFDSSVRSGGDHKLSKQISKAGYKIAYAPDVIVRHPARTSFDELTRKRRRVIGGTYTTQCRGNKKPFPIFVAFLFKETLMRMHAIATRLPLRPLDRLRVGGLLIVLCGISVAEAFRLQLGGEPRRQ
jgi:cellulose synthase/poly-beta-1,6-N-acetylglucosamine synthase-like glycosyltransferase